MGLDKFHTKVVGTTFEGRQDIIRRLKLYDVKMLYLERDPTNKFDPSAIKVMANLDGERLQLGFISNKERECQDCGYIGVVENNTCAICGSENIKRNGLASALAAELDNKADYYVEVKEYTGGTGDKGTIGVNIELTRKVV